MTRRLSRRHRQLQPAGSSFSNCFRNLPVALQVVLDPAMRLPSIRLLPEWAQLFRHRHLIGIRPTATVTIPLHPGSTLHLRPPRPSLLPTISSLMGFPKTLTLIYPPARVSTIKPRVSTFPNQVMVRIPSLILLISSSKISSLGLCPWACLVMRACETEV